MLGKSVGSRIVRDEVCLMASLLIAISRDAVPQGASVDTTISNELRHVKQYSGRYLNIAGDNAILTSKEAIAECNSEAT